MSEIHKQLNLLLFRIESHYSLTNAMAPLVTIVMMIPMLITVLTMKITNSNHK